MKDKRMPLLSANIKAERVRKGLTQEKLAELIDMHERSISQIEQAKQIPSAFVVFDIAKALNISLDELFKGID